VTGGITTAISPNEKVIDPQTGQPVPDPLDGKKGDEAPGERPSLTVEPA